MDPELGVRSQAISKKYAAGIGRIRYSGLILAGAGVLGAHTVGAEAPVREAVNPRSTGKGTVSQSVETIASFRGLGAWVDTYDLAEIRHPAKRVADMERHGVRTIYLGTSRFGLRSGMAYPRRVAEWLDSAHQAGLRVVGWYVPDYVRPARDLRRTLAIDRYISPTGQRFDGVAVDIEFRPHWMPVATWNQRVAAHLHTVDASTAQTVGAIVLPPQAMRLRPDLWSEFPWQAVARHADVVLPMSYWTQSTPKRLCPTTPGFCAYGYTVRNTRQARAYTGLPVHTIGGIGDRAKPRQVARYVAGLRDAQSIGGGLYDYLTTKPEFWLPLRGANGLDQQNSLSD